MNWYRLASIQNDSTAQYTIGFYYDQERGVPQDYEEAFKWFKLAADQGHEAAQYQLGLAYEMAKGVPEDRIEAHKWQDIAASAPAPSENRDNAVKKRDYLARFLKPAEISEVQKRARE